MIVNNGDRIVSIHRYKHTYEGDPVAKRPGFFMCELYNINRRKVCDGIFNDGIGNSFYCKKND